MIAHIIRWSVANRFLVLLLTVMLVGWGLLQLKATPLDAIPDLSDVQVIVKTSYPGQAPQVVEDQVTYPLTTAMLAVPGAVTVRGYSFFGDSFVYIIFEDGTDLYWARSRVLEYLSQVIGNLPNGVNPALGPDATGVGWVYEYALVDRTGTHDLSELRTIQDWFLKFELQTVPGVAEVATIGGMVKQYQVVVDPDRLRAYGLPLAMVRQSIQRANQEVGGSVIEMAEAEYMIRASGYIKSEEHLRQVPLGVSSTGTPILLDHVADIRLGPQLRRGVAELDGEGEVVGGVVIMRWGENAMTTIRGVKDRLDALKGSLPEGVEIVTTYDRSGLIDRAVETLKDKLIEEMIAVAIVCALFLFHLRSALVAIVTLPVGILAAFIILGFQGINANIMSLGGLAIAIGAMLPAAIIMVENMHKHMERDPLPRENRWKIVRESAAEVGPAMFFALLIITLSFIPVFTLTGQEGRLFSPLAFTKTYAMAAAAFLSITLVPVLMGYFVRGKIVPEAKNPMNRLLVASYRPVFNLVIRFPKTVIVLALIATVLSAWPVRELGNEFMPDLDEGDLLYMPSAFPGISVGKAREFLQQSNKLIATVPEVETVFGKVGRAESATDPAPLTMVETTIRLKSREEWRPGVTMASLKAELDALVRFPGITNAWVMPIKNRIDMLATGIKTPVGIKVAGPDLDVIAEIGETIERVMKAVPGTLSVYAERVTGGRFVDIEIDREAAARYALNIADVQDVVRTAIGGMRVAETVEGLERYPINVRYPQDVRDSVERLRWLPIVAPNGAQIPLGDVADIRINSGPGMIKSENARLNGWIFVDISGRDLGSYVVDAQRAVAEQIVLPEGYSLAWSGQFEYMERAQKRMAVAVPITLIVIMLLLYLHFRRFAEVLMIMLTLPVSLIGGFWLLYLLDFNMSVAVGVGFIALAGVAVENVVIILVYLNDAFRRRGAEAQAAGRALAAEDFRQIMTEGALMRVRPIMMTVAAIVGGLLPIMIGTGTGAEVMQRIAAPMVGGMASATVLTLVVIPAIFLLWMRFTARRRGEFAHLPGNEGDEHAR